MSESNLQAVLFDIGGVIITDGPDMRQVATVLGLPPTGQAVARVNRMVWQVRDAYDLGLSDEDYWAQVACLSQAPRPPSQQTVAELIAMDVERWHRPRSQTVELMQAIHNQGLAVGVLSNAPHALSRSFASLPWTWFLSVRVFSCDLGVAKPAQAIYRACLDQLGLDAGKVGFFDDRADNVLGAQAVGIRAALWVDTTEARKRLVKWGLHLPEAD